MIKMNHSILQFQLAFSHIVKIFVFIIFFTAPLGLLSEAITTVYTIDMSKLLKQTQIGKKIIAEDNIARQNLQSENDELEENLLFEEKELSDMRKTLTLDEFRIKAQEFDKKVTIIRTEQGQKEQHLIAENRKNEKDFFKKIYPLLYGLLSEKGGLILLDQRNAVLWDSSVDLTKDAINLIDRVLGDNLSEFKRLVN